ncbi:Crp/Fnr family transcriptional regulator [Sphingopyxis sp.]|uniref:Crp/Fnr family transcriptional regulator n=1 Tax=Sphingopyxis sp. TaxID=1908224 RepID=UPI002D78AAE0|nr:Crp/Fnr family transcriptional regulator [Sphingopyxis sp.]HET6526863.1 Crp/Fnr family transcriptional regulator [Sphingopyxis sp.]
MTGNTPIAEAPVGAPAPDPRLGIFLRKLLSHSLLSAEDQRLLASVPFQLRRIEPNEYILREGDPTHVCPILLSGFVFRQKIAADGGRQIVMLKIPGDPLDFQSIYMRTADHSIQAMTEVELAMVPLPALEGLVIARPAIARAVLVDILIEASIGREWQLNLGRRHALERLAHFLCELVHRMQITQPELGDQLALPMTQEQLADMLGLTPVHVNRTLRALDGMGLIARRGRRVHVADLPALCRISGFSPTYLHRGNHGN